jgi:hypothetical protein
MLYKQEQIPFSNEWDFFKNLMRKDIAKFYKKREKEDFYFEDIKTANFITIPENRKGAYILLATDDSEFLYPKKDKSKVFYIGMSSNLRNRLKTHQKEIKRIQKMNFKDRWDNWYWEKYQYAASFGCEIFVFTTRGVQTPKRLEREIIEHFYNQFYGKPVANGAFSF